MAGGYASLIVVQKRPLRKHPVARFPLQHPATARRGTTQPNPSPTSLTSTPPLGMSSCSCSGDAVTVSPAAPQPSHRCARCHSNQSQSFWNKPCTRQLRKTAGSGLGPTPSARSRSLEIGSRTRVDPQTTQARMLRARRNAGRGVVFGLLLSGGVSASASATQSATAIPPWLCGAETLDPRILEATELMDQNTGQGYGCIKELHSPPRCLGSCVNRTLHSSVCPQKLNGDTSLGQTSPPFVHPGTHLF